ncbi:uncharacterized protein LOC109122134 [Vitis vinifera]|uniref:uncharacterized protein LOC109122134 n=1 Tax=Vitis vinifera TaxID=29760 RepID=UPI0008FEC23C|nr:uncharacterized protein LOC109122134 [Vitis vinifera]|eukprot:XP_019073957.1 PREDICTED: uncharacterized protein LOC109122134 [Vitis vinifera]
MCCVNLRFSVPYAINIFKIFQVGILGWDWDPYNIMGDLSWMKVICFLLLLGFSFISIEGPPTPSINPRFAFMPWPLEFQAVSLSSLQPPLHHNLQTLHKSLRVILEQMTPDQKGQNMEIWRQIRLITML